VPVNAYVSLAVAIVAEVIATSSLKAAEGFTRLVPSAIVVIGYGLSFYCLSLTLRTMPIGIAYGIWSGVGIVLVSGAGWLLFGQRLDLAALIGLGLIIAGVLVVNLFSASTGH
jgi:small multidrug resistance pump